MSPNGDGILDTVRVAIAASGADRWAFSAAPVTGSTVGAAVTDPVSGAGGSASVDVDRPDERRRASSPTGPIA